MRASTRVPARAPDVSTELAALPLPPGPGPLASLLALGRNPAVYFQKLFNRYGPVVRWRGYMDMYLLNNPDDVRTVLTQAWPRFTKRNIDYRVLRQTMGMGLVTSDGEFWTRQRRLMQPMFHARVVNGFDRAINRATADLAARWRDRPADEAFALDREMSRLTFRIVGETLFGAGIEEHADAVAELLDQTNVNPKTLSGLLTLWPWLPVPSNSRFKRQMKLFDDIVYGLIHRRRESGEERSDLLGLLLAARDEQDQPMPDRQIRDEAITLLLAGHETSATALDWTFHLLGQHPEVEATLLDELTRVLNGAPATAADLARLPFLKQVVQESMRLYPPVWGLSRHAEQDAEFGGYRIPKDAYVVVMPYTLHRHPDWWENPETFDPGRFSPARSEGRHSYAYLPFSAGPRACIGIGMSMLEVQLVLAQLLPQFKVRTVPGHPVIPQPSVTYRPRFGVRATASVRS